MYPTIVTMFYKINNSQRSTETYIENAKKFILTLPYPLVIYINSNEKELFNLLSDEREKNGLTHLTRIYENDIKDTYFYKDLSLIKNLQTTFHIVNGDLNHETPIYVILNNNKFCFMEKTIEANPFESSHFVWMDFGINHVAKNTEYIHTWIDKVPDKIKQLCINPYIEPIKPKEYFERIYHNCAGGLFTGSKENMLMYIALFKQKTKQIYAEGWYQIDEAVMTLVHRENPHLFDFFYGDYEGIISNYLKPLHSWWLIRLNIDKCRSFDNTYYLYNILTYLDSYFIDECNQHSDDFYNYIINNIISNYYHNSKLLRGAVVALIQLKLNINDHRMKNLVSYNESNLNFYQNKYLIKSNEFLNKIETNITA